MWLSTQVFHWLARAGIRDQTLMALMGNEALFRLSDDFVLDMRPTYRAVYRPYEACEPPI